MSVQRSADLQDRIEWARSLEAAAAFKNQILAELARHPFQPPKWLKNAHLQTMWPVFFRKAPARKSNRERLETPDGDFLDLYVQWGQPEKPIVLLLHGLEGTVESKYLLGLHDEFSRTGWSAITMEFRSCGGEMNRTKRLYHLGETTDLNFVVSWLIEHHPQNTIYLSGISLGGNVLLKWLGESGENVPRNVRAAATICAPYDLVLGGPYMDRRIMFPYRQRFMRTLVSKAIAKEKQFPGSMDINKISQSRTFAEFDTHATAVLHGFKDCWDYWGRCSSGQFLSGIRVPTMLISAADDPFNPAATLPHGTCDAQPWLIPQFTAHGGHVGFVTRGEDGSHAFWAEEQVARYFQICAK
jgi:predicted alpha/beta-fold hydrolase